MQSAKKSLTVLLEVIAQENQLTDRSKTYIDVLAHQITHLEGVYAEYTKMFKASQQSTWINSGPNFRGRWLARETDRFPPCANS